MSQLPKKSTMFGSPPAGYQPGIGRGATVFVTRADLGETTLGIKTSSKDPFGIPPPGYVPGRGRGATGFAGGVSRDDTVDDRGDYSDTNFDEFSGYSEGLFRDGQYDEEDRQADFVYDSIEQRMDSRRKSRREAKLIAELCKLRAEKPTINQQFADLKRGLASVTQEEWESIPDIGDYTLKMKQKKGFNSSVYAPDSLLSQARNLNEPVKSIDLRSGIGGGATTPIGLGLQTPIGIQTPLGLKTPLSFNTGLMSTCGGYRTQLAGGTTPSLNDLGEARETVLSVKLDKVMDNVSGQTVIDPKGYLTDLNSIPVSTDAHIADVKKARLLLRSVIQTNPNHAPGWIAAARLEEIGGKIQAARELIAQGCIHCSKNEDIWLEAARLEKPTDAKAILANGVKRIPQSVKLWQEAANREDDVKTKKLVLRKALQFVPNSVRLWKEAISLEEPNTARLMLQTAVECVPQSVEMWLALAKLSTYEDAQKVLNEARKQAPTSVEIWLSASKLEETHGNIEMVYKIMLRAVENLQTRGVTLDRDIWLKYAEDSEKIGYVVTCRAIVKATMDIGVEDVNREKIWSSDAENALAHGRIETTRALYQNILSALKASESIWMALAQLELQHGVPSSLDAVLSQAVENCPQSEALWLMAAKHKWLLQEVNAARALLAEAFRHVTNKEVVSLAAVKLEREIGEYERARLLLDQARVRCNYSQKVWMQSVQLERMLENYERAHELVAQALTLYPKSYKLWLISGQLYLEDSSGNVAAALDQFEKGRKECPTCVHLWLCTVKIYSKQKLWSRARALLEEARLKNPKQELLWLAAVKIETEAAGVTEQDLESGNTNNKNLQVAHHIVSRALQECPKSGILWAEAIFLESKSGQNAKSVDALRNCENDSYVILAVAKLFGRNGKIFKARRWLNLAVTLNPKLGDTWGMFLAMEIVQGKDENRMDVIERSYAADPNEGLRWNKIAKNPRNWRLSLAEKLRLFVEEVEPLALQNAAEKNLIGKDIMDILYGRVAYKAVSKPQSDIAVSQNEQSEPNKQESSLK